MGYVKKLAAAALMVTGGALPAQAETPSPPGSSEPAESSQEPAHPAPSPPVRSLATPPSSPEGKEAPIQQALRHYANPLKRLQLEMEATKKYLTYTIRQGDTLSEIAQRFDIPMEEIAATNQIADVHRIRAGDTIKIRKKEIPYVVKRGDTLPEIAKKHGLDPDEIVAHNPMLSRHNHTIFPGQTLLLPTQPAPPVKATAQARGERRQAVKTVSLTSRTREDPSRSDSSPAVQTSPKGGRFQWPVQGRLTSSFGLRHGRMHNGVDIQSPQSGAPVKAARSGLVHKAGRMRGYGNIVILSHGDGWETYYAHLSRIAVRPGQKVAAGQVVGYQGKTGNATGEHLHFEVRLNGRPLNPLDYLP